MPTGPAARMGDLTAHGGPLVPGPPSPNVFIGGQPAIEVQALPFRMTDANMHRHKSNPHYAFWATLKQGYDFFEQTRQPPSVAVCERRYVVNVKSAGQKPNPEGACPRFEPVKAEPFTPLPAPDPKIADTVVEQGPKQRTAQAAQSEPAEGAARVGPMSRSRASSLPMAFGLGSSVTRHDDVFGNGQ